MLTKCMYPVAWVGGPKGLDKPSLSGFLPVGGTELGGCLPPRLGKAVGDAIYRGNSTQATLAVIVAETSLGTQCLGATVGSIDQGGGQRGWGCR